MLMTNYSERSLFDSLFEEFVRPSRYAVKCTAPVGVMKTDIQENEEGFVIDMELPGFRKENVKAELNEGYLTITASTENKEEKSDDNRKFIRKERYVGECKRSFYVGRNIEKGDITARFEDGILELMIPKKELKPAEEKDRLIEIAG